MNKDMVSAPLLNRLSRSETLIRHTPARTLVMSNTLIPANGKFLEWDVEVAIDMHRIDILALNLQDRPKSLICVAKGMSRPLNHTPRFRE